MAIEFDINRETTASSRCWLLTSGPISLVKSTYLALTLGAAGLLTGFAGHRLSGMASVDEPEHATRADTGRNSPDSSPQRKVRAGKTDVSSIRSTDTLESLKALPPEDLYGRLALWMIDATEEEIADYWQDYRNQENRANEINDLIFINWARLNPQGAVNAATGTPDEHYAWWAWSCHDPAGSLAAVIAQNPDRLNNVTWGLGEFHPDWVREHWDDIPADGQQNALQGMAKWDDVGNPLEVLNFLQEKGYGFHQNIFKVLISKDPWAAYEKIQESGGQERSPFGGTQNTLRLFVETVAEQHPEMLEKLASQTPSGELKWQMEAALFDSLLKSDPEAALQQALATSASKVATDQLTAVGTSLLASDPDRAFEMAERIFSLNPEAMEGMTRVSYGSGSSGWGSGTTELDRLMNTLVTKDPVRALELTMFEGDQNHRQSAFQKVAAMWAVQDLQGYADWVNGQAESENQPQAVGVIVGHLQNDQNFGDAAAWAASIDDPQQRQNVMSNLVRQWARADRESAANWLQSTTLTADELKNYRSYLPTEP